ncbi:Asp-tRNA(Asn)/Glu-tRNA(Gln) amidotransferase subunit GatA [Anaerobranca gottschalkii]|uniref:Glutamyl-tRNA(Gln) amidotransferase subunit A n=1 Tax=Anaerobranca gottschalkii DSM 13577 TaxID=1120990 RepID=A0A1I0ANH6_9FIRM|nr:Asp-tRNA(Asn)/Glu-tRNA(Gln) amidotransferase subunit GatA [Anaerobranca gottschalkii]SES95307.1 aspartyl/glutamyl-tRNA(Asn/Gln) amidotransferase subunit A [Anaerobranca gottschalkii DSM 13577]
MFIKKINKILNNKEISPVELTKTFLSRIEGLDTKIDSFLQVTIEQSIKIAEEVEKKIMDGKKINLLEGIPMNLKDNISTKGIKTTGASLFLQDYIPPYSATVYQKLKGCPLLGKVNLDEFAMGTSTETSAYKKTKNPWDLTKVPGGSSGGSAASVAAGFGVFSLGTDTGGSIRQPASFCGVVGLKPTYGLVSRYGVFPLASSLDVVGPLTKTVEDCALVLGEIKGKDPKDPMTVEVDGDYEKALARGIKGIKLGIAPQFIPKETQPDVLKAFWDSVKLLEDLGGEIVEINLPHLSYGIDVYSILAYGEAASNLARLDGIRYGFNKGDITYNRTKGLGFEVKRRIMLGTYFLKGENYERYYLKAKAVQQQIKRDFQKAFEKCDAILSPTTINTAFDLGAKLEPHIMAYNDLLTIPVNLAGIPALSLPCGFDQRNLPIGLQIISNSFREDLLFTVGHNYQLHTNYHLLKPPFIEGVDIYGL